MSAPRHVGRYVLAVIVTALAALLGVFPAVYTCECWACPRGFDTDLPEVAALGAATFVAGYACSHVAAYRRWGVPTVAAALVASGAGLEQMHERGPRVFVISVCCGVLAEAISRIPQIRVRGDRARRFVLAAFATTCALGFCTFFSWVWPIVILPD